MIKTRTAAVAGLAAAALSLSLAGCGSANKTAESPAGGDKSAAGATISSAAVAPEAMRNATLNRYITDNKIAEVPIKPDEPGTPKVDFPFPPDWVSAGDRTPEWAYGAIIYEKAVDPEDPPFIYAIASKLTGDVDPAKIIELAPGQLNDLPKFTAIGEPERSKVGGFDAIDYVGTYVWEGKTRAVGQQTIVIPGKDAVFVMQLNGEAPEGQEQAVIDAAKLIQEKTSITLPS